MRIEIYILRTIENNASIDYTQKAKMDFYLDKLAKMVAAKARNQRVAVVTNGVAGVPRLVIFKIFQRKLSIFLAIALQSHNNRDEL